MRYYIDTEFNEHFIKMPLSRRSYHVIDLISIALVADDGREYYAVNKDFDLRAAWDKYQMKFPEMAGDPPVKEYWLRDNVLYPLWKSLYEEENRTIVNKDPSQISFTYKGLEKLIQWHGKLPEVIAKEIHEFTSASDKPSFYAWYGAYDWVAFCSIFGTMMDLPNGYPMYVNDLKQTFDELQLDKAWKEKHCPDPEGEHDALVDARWNRKLYKELTNVNPLSLNIKQVKRPLEKPFINIADLSDLSNIPKLTKDELKESDKWQPNNLYEAVWFMIDQMGEDYKKKVKSREITQDQFVYGNQDWGGLHIRNEWYLNWYPNHGFESWPAWKPQIVSYFNALGITSATDMSNIVYRSVYKTLQGEPLEFHETVTEEQVNWLREQGK